MTMVFIEGPRGGETEQSYSVIPTQVVPVYESADDGASVCADEQVIKRLGVYRRRPRHRSAPMTARWYYDWEPESERCKGWAESDLEHAAHGSDNALEG